MGGRCAMTTLNIHKEKVRRSIDFPVYMETVTGQPVNGRKIRNPFDDQGKPTMTVFSDNAYDWILCTHYDIFTAIMLHENCDFMTALVIA